MSLHPVHGMVRKTALAIAAAFCLLLLLGNTMAWTAQEAGTDQRMVRAEKETQVILGELEQKLLKRLRDDAPPASEVWRMRLIHAAMWGPLADFSQWFLCTLGASETARDGLFFIMPLVRWMSEPFIFPVETTGSAETVDAETAKVFALMARLQEQGFRASLDNVGDASLSPEDAAAYRAYYRTLIEEFIKKDEEGQLNMSLKLSALVHDLDAAVDGKYPDQAEAKKEEIRQSLTELLKAASQAPDKDIFLRIDMEEYVFKDMTLDLFREVVEKNPDIARDAKGNLRLGVVIQAYLRDSGADLEKLAQWGRKQGVRVPVRLVKGAYLKHEREVAEARGVESPVWNFKPSTDANYEALCAWLLLSRDAIKPAFATHNLRSISHAMALARVLSVPVETLEFQMLYGMGDPIKHVVVQSGYAMREYIPAGSLARGLAYAGRRFHELASGDNALARTMRGDFSAYGSGVPEFQGNQDIRDGKKVMEMLRRRLEE